MLREIQLQADLVDCLELVLDPVDVRLFVGNHILEHLACRVVPHTLAVGDRLAQRFYGLDLQLEVEAVEALREAITHCQSVGDYTTRKMFEDMIASEESHIDWIENQLEAINQIGLELYLSQQLKEE